MPGTARFFSFDGIDGAGKSTQLRLFADWLRRRGQDVVECRDPGSTEVGEALRAVLLERKTLTIDRRCEMLIYMAARAQLVDEVIRPALQSGRTVVSDRFVLSNIVYQAHAGGLDVSMVRQLGAIATDGVVPDLTLVLDLAPAAAANRIQRGTDRMEDQGREFFERVRNGFLREAKENPDHIAVIDASQPIDAIQDNVRTAAASLLELTIQ